MDAILIRVLSIKMRLEYSGEENSNSDVIRRTTVAKTSHDPISDNVSGKFMHLTTELP
jgi:hypothetical protein